MAGNSDPIYSRRGAITRGVLLKTAAADYNGQSPYNKEVFAADITNGSYLQRLRFKAVGTNVASVARIYLNDGDPAESFGTASAAPTGVASGTGGTILAATYYGLVIGVDADGRMTPTPATISAGTTTTGSTSSISWSWSAIPGAVLYRLYVGVNNTVDGLNRYFTSATTSFNQTAPHTTGVYDDANVGNSKFYGELSLPATTAIATAATVDIDYPMNIALPPGWEVYVGLGTTVAAGWHVVGIGGDY